MQKTLYIIFFSLIVTNCSFKPVVKHHGVPYLEKKQALLQSSKRKGLLLDDKTIKYIISYTSRSLSDLLRLLNELDSFSLKKKKKISPSLVREMVNTK